MRKYTDSERTEIIKQMANDQGDDCILNTKLADFMPIEADDSPIVTKLAQDILNVCNHKTDIPHKIITSSIGLALFSACSSFLHTAPSPSKLIH